MPMITKLSAVEASPCVYREYSRQAAWPREAIEKVQCPPLNEKLVVFHFYKTSLVNGYCVNGSPRISQTEVGVCSLCSYS